MSTRTEDHPEIPHQSKLLWVGSLAMLIGLGAFGYLVIGFAGGSSGSGQPPASTSIGIVAPDENAAVQDATGQNEVGPDLPDPGDTDQPGELVGSYTVDILESFPSSPSAYTQGLELFEGRLLRSNGQYGDSARQWVDPATGLAEVSVELDDQIFGEGITIADSEVYQLTWKSGVVYISDLDGLSEQRTATYSGEGWGLCFDGTRLIRSDGTNRLSFHEPGSFDLIGSVDIFDADGVAVDRLNELECVNGQVLANIYLTDQIVVLDPGNGVVDAVIDASNLRPADVPFDSDHVLNGIAYREQDASFYMTGKYWPTLHRVELQPVSG